MDVVMSLGEDASTLPADYLRVASIAIAAYEYIITLPAEYRFYKSQRGICELSQGCILFILIRYLSATAIITSNVVFFAPLSENICHRVYLLAIPFRLAAVMTSQVILAARCYAIARRAPWVLYTLGITFILFSAAEGFVNFWGRIPKELQGHCLSGNGPAVRVVWLHYLLAMFYDLLTLVISTYYLWLYTPSSRFMTTLVKTLMVEGIGYFLILTLMNILNLIIFKQASLTIQSAAVTLGVAVTWITSQRILLSLRERSLVHSSLSTVPTLAAAYGLPPGAHSDYDDGQGTNDTALSEAHVGLQIGMTRRGYGHRRGGGGRGRGGDGDVEGQDDDFTSTQSAIDRRDGDAKDWLPAHSHSPVLEATVPAFAGWSVASPPNPTPNPTAATNPAPNSNSPEIRSVTSNSTEAPPSALGNLARKIRHGSFVGLGSRGSGGSAELASFGQVSALSRSSSRAGDVDVQVHVERTVDVQVDAPRGAPGYSYSYDDVAGLGAGPEYLRSLSSGPGLPRSYSYYGGGEGEGREDYSTPAVAPSVSVPLALARLSEGGEEAFPEGRVIVSRAAV